MMRNINWRNLRKSQPRITFVLMMISVSLFLPVVTAESLISVNFNRNMGSYYDNNMSGDWTIKAEGPANLTFIGIFFNTTMEANASSNEISFNFNTEKYNVGTYNITVIGYDAQGNQYQSESFIRNFVESNDALIFGIIGGIAGLVGMIALVQYIRKKRKGAEPQIQKSDVSLNLDKDLL